MGGRGREPARRFDQMAAFFRRVRPQDGEFEDAPGFRLVRSAKYELLRVYYLRKEFEKADAMLKAIQKSADSKECELLRAHYRAATLRKPMRC